MTFQTLTQMAPSLAPDSSVDCDGTSWKMYENQNWLYALNKIMICYTEQTRRKFVQLRFLFSFVLGQEILITFNAFQKTQSEICVCVCVCVSSQLRSKRNELVCIRWRMIAKPEVKIKVDKKVTKASRKQMCLIGDHTVGSIKWCVNHKKSKFEKNVWAQC